MIQLNTLLHEKITCTMNITVNSRLDCHAWNLLLVSILFQLDMSALQVSLPQFQSPQTQVLRVTHLT